MKICHIRTAVVKKRKKKNKKQECSNWDLDKDSLVFHYAAVKILLNSTFHLDLTIID